MTGQRTVAGCSGDSDRPAWRAAVVAVATVTGQRTVAACSDDSDTTASCLPAYPLFIYPPAPVGVSSAAAQWFTGTPEARHVFEPSSGAGTGAGSSRETQAGGAGGPARLPSVTKHWPPPHHYPLCECNGWTAFNNSCIRTAAGAGGRWRRPLPGDGPRAPAITRRPNRRPPRTERHRKEGHRQGILR